MRPFRFRLKGILRLRCLEEERCVRELRLRQEAHGRKLDELTSLQERREAELYSARAKDDADWCVEEARRRGEILSRLRRREFQIRDEIDRLEEELEESQRDAERATRSRQVVEELRERAYREHLVEQERAAEQEREGARRAGAEATHVVSPGVWGEEMGP